MKFSKEAKVGALAVIAITILYLGFNFLKGLDVFSRANDYTTYYSDVMGLQKSNPVTFNGVTVGRVMDIIPDQEADRVKVVLTINKDIQLTDQTVALLADADLLGSKVIKLAIGKGNLLEGKNEIKGGVESGLLASTTKKLDPTLQKVDSLLTNLNVVVKQFENTGNSLKVLMASATQTTNGVNGIVAANSKSLQAITQNAATLTANLNALSQNLDSQLKPILSKTNSFADSLSAVQIGQTVQQLNTTVAGLQGVLKDINSGKGTIGKLTQDDSLYVNLDRTAASLNALLSDMKASPKRYVHFSLFGGKKEKK